MSENQTLAEIIAALSKPLPDSLLQTKTKGGTQITFMSWRTCQRILDKHAPGWSGKVTQIVCTGDRTAVGYAISIPTSDCGDVMRSATGTEDEEDSGWGDPVTKAEQQAFKRAAARFGLGLYLYDGKATPQARTDAPAVRQVNVPQLQNGHGDLDVVPQMRNPEGAPSDKQINAIYAIGKAAKRWGEPQVETFSLEIFGALPRDLTKGQASQLIDRLKGNEAA